MSELLPCPFCGSDMIEECATQTGSYYVCENCDSSCGEDINWNTRPIEDALQAEIDRLIELQRKMPLVADRRGAELSHLRAQHTRLIDQCKRLADELCGYVGADGNAPGSAELSNFDRLMKELNV